MRVVKKAARMNPVQFLRRTRRMPRNDIRLPFAGNGPGYSQGDPNTFPEEMLYRENFGLNGEDINLTQHFPATAALNRILQDTGSRLRPGARRKGFQNRDDFSLTPIVCGTVSVQAVSQNFKRSALLIQNLSTTDNLFFNFGVDASPTSGIKLLPEDGFFFDIRTPNDAIYVVFDAAAQNCVIAEAQRP